jgi:hypothetical protein
VRTDELIRALAADAARPVAPINRLLGIALVIGIALSAGLFLATLRARPDLMAGDVTLAFCFKLIVTFALAVTAYVLLSDAARPLPRAGWRLAVVLAIAPLILVGGVAFELITVPTDDWMPRLVGHNATHCLSLIPLLSIAPAACLLLALRRGAPAQPGLAGAIAGLVSGALGASLYALTCPDDSALFVATWYTIAIAAVTVVSTFIGRRVLRW